MKLLLTLALSLCLACQCLSQTPTNPTPNPGKGTNDVLGIVCGLVLCGCVVAGCYVVYIYVTSNQCAAHHKLVLERSHLDGNWVPIATNITLVTTNKIEVFRERMTGDEFTCYRVLDLGRVQQ